MVVNRDQLEHGLRSKEPGYDHLDERIEFDEPVLLPDGRVLSVVRTILTWRETGEHAATIERGLLFTLENELIVEHRMFPSPEAARSSAELDRSNSAAPAA